MKRKKAIRSVPLWKWALGMLAALFVLHAVLFTFARLVGPDTRPQPSDWTPADIAEAEEVRRLPERLERQQRINLEIPASEYERIAAWRKLHPAPVPEEIGRAVEAGELPPWYPRGQSPLMTRLEQENLLPPVDQRVGPEPAVFRGVEGLGQYGGVWVYLIAGGLAEANAVEARINYNRLFRFSPQGFPIVPHIAKSYEVKEGGRVWEITLRQVRWSDGEPFTSEDLRYYWEDELLSRELKGGAPKLPKYYTLGGKPGKLEVLGPHKVRYVFTEPRGDFLEVLAFNSSFRPAHYLKKYHPKYADPKFIQREMSKYNMPNVRALYSLMSLNNPELPSMNPWVYRKHTTMSPITYVRNPYYFVVDEAGNQLPYIDRVQAELIDGMMLPLAVSNGRATMQFRYLRFEDYINFASRARVNDYRLLGWLPGTRSEWVINPNMNRPVTPDDPQSELKSKLLFEADFRKALSLAIDREAAIEALFSGYAEPWQVDPGPYSKYPSEKLRHAYTSFDPDRANELLDGVWRKLGLDPTVRKDGYRCDAAGKPVAFYMIFTDFTGLGPGQFIVDDWKKVGIRCIFQQCSRPLLNVRRTARNFEFYIWSSETDLLPLLSPRAFAAVDMGSAYAVGWSMWAMNNGMYNAPESKNPGAIPVPKDHPMYRVLDAYEKAIRSTSEEEKTRLMTEITDLAAENVWTINVACSPPKLLTVSNRMRNVPEKAIDGFYFLSPGHTGVETYYLTDPSRAADDDTLEQLRTVETLPPAAGLPNTTTATVIKSLLVVIGFLLLTLLILRHPFVLRRLVIMAPTLLVISIAVFTIIQLPPGDYLSNRIVTLQESGVSQEQIQQQIEDLRAIFRFDDPAWKRYCRWMGFSWFLSFDQRDTGLLQGNMGYSMETSKSVNSMLGDRVLLTVLISLGTVLLTWSLALPIGIYSACRQYSIGDYAISLIGFLGMCIPSFLLALILMALTGISGLFSAEYAVQPSWDWGKFCDLLRHIWVPVLVVGVAGTAGMIRVMRANLLDELRKPYVTTARAKGVRPVRLLFKYPVRMALNPFISGIGTLFPSLVSGSSIVAIVMSLPTVGPLMLTALFSQDMYMAGSMLMVLSMLGVLGTLVSDLLLMAVDPRIRIGGGK